MASRSLGVLTVDLILKMGGFEEGMDKAARETDKAARNMKSLAREGERLEQSIATPIQKAAQQIARYNELLKAGVISQETYAKASKQIADAYNANSEAGKKYAQQQADAARLTASLQTNQQKYAASVASANALLKAGAIDQATYNAAINQSKAAYAAASASHQAFNKVKAEGKALTVALRTPQEQLTAAVSKYDAMLKVGAIDQETYNRAVARAKGELGATKTAMQSTASALSGMQRLLIGGGMIALAKSALDARISIEAMNATLKAVTGSQAAANTEFEFAATTAKNLGLNFEATVGSYAKFTAAAKGTTLEGEKTKDIFVAVAEAARVLGLSAENTEGVFNALQQMISKGTVQAEELRGQLGDRLPGAFQIAARAMGMTTAELGKAMQAGEVMATDLLPKLAVELHKTFGPESAEAAKNLGSAIERTNTQWLNFKASLAAAGGGGPGGGAGLAEQVFGGWAVMLGNALDPVDALELKIRDLEAQIKAMQTTSGAPMFPGEVARLKVLQDELKKLKDLADKTRGLGDAGIVPRRPAGAAGAAAGPPISKEDAAAAAKVFAEVQTAAEKFRAEVTKLDHLLEIKAITPEVYRLRFKQLREELEKKPKSTISQAAREAEEALRKQADAYKAIQDAGQSAYDALKTPTEKAIDQYHEAEFALKKWAEEYPAMADRAAEGLKRLEQTDIARLEVPVITAEHIFPKKERKELSEFWKSAQQEMQSILADFLENPFDKGIEGFIQQCTDMFRKISAQAVAAQISEKLFAGLPDAMDKAQDSLKEMFSGGFLEGVKGMWEKVAGIFTSPEDAQTPGIIADNGPGIAGAAGAAGTAAAEAAATAGAAASTAAAITAAGTAAGAAITAAGTAAGAAFSAALATATAALTAAGTTVAGAIAAAGTTAAAAIASAAGGSSAASGIGAAITAGMGGGAAGGGFTGFGGKFEPAGIFHGKEFVIRSESTMQPGAIPFLHEFNLRGMALLRDLNLPGFATGGMVMAPAMSLPGRGVSTPSANARNMRPNVLQQITVTTQGGTINRQTELQITAAAARGVKNADRRNN